MVVMMGIPTDKGIVRTGGRHRLMRAVAIAGMLVSIVVMAAPVATDWWFALQASQAIDEITAVYDNLSDADRDENIRQARAYNARLAGQSVEETYPDYKDLSGSTSEVPEDDIWEYDVQLTYHGTPQTMMSHIDIPKIGTHLPIYHHTDASVLSAGVGHLEGTSLPVGGLSSRCVLTAHSGMDRTKMFDDIRLLEKGDVFVLWTLSEPYAYRVTEIDTILPDELNEVRPVVGRDLCTLVTCTPFGVNTHRLLVTGERCDYEAEDDTLTSGVEAYVNRRTIPMLVGIAAVLLVLVTGAVAGRRRRRKSGRKAAGSTTETKTQGGGAGCRRQ